MTVVFRDNGIIFGEDPGLLQQQNQQQGISPAQDNEQGQYYDGAQTLPDEYFVAEDIVDAFNDAGQMWIWDPAILFG